MGYVALRGTSPAMFWGLLCGGRVRMFGTCSVAKRVRPNATSSATKLANIPDIDFNPLQEQCKSFSALHLRRRLWATAIWLQRMGCTVAWPCCRWAYWFLSVNDIYFGVVLRLLGLCSKTSHWLRFICWARFSMITVPPCSQFMFPTVDCWPGQIHRFLEEVTSQTLKFTVAYSYWVVRQ